LSYGSWVMGLSRGDACAPTKLKTENPEPRTALMTEN
jgi:hypothetical protein